jgi:hypothetical protein
MKARTLQILWHDKSPVLSADFHPDGYLATAGADKEIKARESRHFKRASAVARLLLVDRLWLK